MPDAIPPRDAAYLERFILERLAALRKKPLEELDPSRPFNELGVDSLDAVSLTGELEERLGLTIDPAELFDHPTPRALAQFLAGSAPRGGDGG